LAEELKEKQKRDEWLLENKWECIIGLAGAVGDAYTRPLLLPLRDFPFFRYIAFK
jgi:hypothetical protein